ncbi:MAG: hypothetical protein J2P36_18655 [Ktedonobacteraceae bacterium]|nr:hypothetical protein [Ktedonobacteraceae bacterium]
MKSLIGIYTRPSDDHLERVIEELDRRHLPYVRFDTQDFPQSLQLAATIDSHAQEGWHETFTLSGKPYRLEDVRSI